MDLVAGRAFAQERRPIRHVDWLLIVIDDRAVDRRAAPPVLRHQPDAAPGGLEIRSTA